MVRSMSKAHPPAGLVPASPALRTALAAADEEDARARIDAFLEYWKGLKREPFKIVPHVRTLLDNVDPASQPAVALVDVIAPSTLSIRLFGTERAAGFGQDVTHANALDYYEPHLRDPVFKRVQCVVRYPVGWTNQRIITTAKGHTVRFLSIYLPLAVDSGAVPCFVNFGAIMDRMEADLANPMVSALAAGEWIDIGAGTPSMAPAF